jgi:tripartite-type tricarboxylate transporter receptor subunit TctC
MTLKSLTLVAMTALSTISLSPYVHAQGDGAPIRLVIGVPAGGSIDVIARLMAEKMKDTLGEPVVVESKAGAGGRIAVNEARNARPDGHTIYIGTSGPFSILPNIYGDKLGYDPVKDFTPIGRLVRFDLSFACGPAVGAEKVSDALAWARANPDRSSFGTPGPGTTSHFVGVMIARATGIKLAHVPYKGGTPAVNDVIGGHMPFIVNSLADMAEQHKAGKLRILAAAGGQRNPLLPDVPTLKESGIDVVADVAIDAYGPANIPAEIVTRLRTAMNQAIGHPDTQQRMRAYGLFPAPASAAELVAFQAAETKMWAEPIRDSGFTGQ